MNGGRVIIIRKKARGHPHHGGAWKVAYADFVTAMMALFIVLWLLSQTDQATRERLSEYFRTGMFSGAPSVVSGGSGVAHEGFLDVGKQAFRVEQQRLHMTAALVRRAIEEKAGESPEIERLKQQVDVQVVDEGLLIQIMDGHDDVFFDLSSAELKPELRKILEIVAPVLTELENKLHIQGHTDSRPFPEGSRRTNWQLSFERAENARVVLLAAGVPAGQVAGVFAFADSVLKVKEDPRADANRRLAILAVRRGGEERSRKGLPTGAPVGATPISRSVPDNGSFPMNRAPMTPASGPATAL